MCQTWFVRGGHSITLELPSIFSSTNFYVSRNFESTFFNCLFHPRPTNLYQRFFLFPILCPFVRNTFSTKRRKKRFPNLYVFSNETCQLKFRADFQKLFIFPLLFLCFVRIPFGWKNSIVLCTHSVSPRALFGVSRDFRFSRRQTSEDTNFYGFLVKRPGYLFGIFLDCTVRSSSQNFHQCFQGKR